MNTRQTSTFVPVLVAAIFTAGCSMTQAPPTAGVVIHEAAGPPRVGAIAPDATFLDRTGKIHRLSSLWEDATIMVFTSAKCCLADPRVVRSTQDLPQGVSVVEISAAPGGCKEHEECVVSRSDKARHIIALCDSQGVLHKRYGVSTPSVVFLVDGDGTIAAVGTIDDLPRIRGQARELVWKADKERELRYGG